MGQWANQSKFLGVNRVPPFIQKKKKKKRKKGKDKVINIIFISSFSEILGNVLNITIEGYEKSVFVIGPEGVHLVTFRNQSGNIRIGYIATYLPA